MAIQFNKHAQEANLFIRELSSGLGQLDEPGKTGIILRAVVHAIRDCITIRDSLKVISQFPMFLKGVYADNWIYQEKPANITTVEQFENLVEEKLNDYGGPDFDWEISIEEMIKVVSEHISQYISPEEASGFLSDLSGQVREIFKDVLKSSRG